MSDRFIRIYDGPEGANMIGFSFRAVPAERDNFPGFMASHGYDVEELRPWGEAKVDEHYDVVKAVGGVSIAYYGIRPPLQEEHKQPLLDWCDEHIDVGANSGYLLDERGQSVPLRPFHYEKDRIVGRW